MFYSACCSYINSTLGRGCLVASLHGLGERGLGERDMRGLVKRTVAGTPLQTPLEVFAAQNVDLLLFTGRTQEGKLGARKGNA